MTPEFYISVDDPPGKQKILTEGLHLFARKGLSATSIRDIGNAAGLSNPALYKHFDTKDALAQALFDRCYRELRVRLGRAIRSHTGFEARFRAMIAAYLAFHDDAPEALMFTIDNLAALWPAVKGDLREATLISDLRELLAEGRAEGCVRPHAEIDVQVIMVTGTLTQLTRQLFLKALSGPAGRYHDQIDSLLRGGLA